MLCAFLFPLPITLVLLVQIFHLKKNWNFKTSLPHSPSFLGTIKSIIKMNTDSWLNNVTCKSSLHTQLFIDFECLLHNTNSHVLFVVNIKLLTFFPWIQHRQVHSAAFKILMKYRKVCLLMYDHIHVCIFLPLPLGVISATKSSTVTCSNPFSLMTSGEDQDT